MLQRKLALAVALSACTGVAGAAMTAEIRNQISSGLQSGADITAVLLQAVAAGATLQEAQLAAAEARPDLTDAIATAAASVSQSFATGMPVASGTPATAAPGSSGGSGGGGGNAIQQAEQQAEQAQAEVEELEQEIAELEEQLASPT